MNETVRQPKGTAKAEPKTARRTASKEVRRQQLIDATITSISKHGIGGTTMSTVTEEAGLSLGIVNFHFQSKQNLFEETLTYLAREHHEHWYKAYSDAGLGARDKLLAIVDAHFHPSICTRKKLSVWFAFYGEVGRRAIYRTLVDNIDDERYEISQRLCQTIIDDGGYLTQDADVVAQMLESLYDGLCLHFLMYPGSLTRAQARLQVRSYLASVFPGHFEMPQP